MILSPKLRGIILLAAITRNASLSLAPYDLRRPCCSLGSATGLEPVDRFGSPHHLHLLPRGDTLIGLAGRGAIDRSTFHLGHYLLSILLLASKLILEAALFVTRVKCRKSVIHPIIWTWLVVIVARLVTTRERVIILNHQFFLWVMVYLKATVFNALVRSV